MGTIDVRVGYGLEWRDGPVGRLLRKRLPEHGLSGKVPLHTAWDASSYGLHRVGAFVEAEVSVREAILADCARGRLIEAYFIEKAGVSYAAKMVLLAESAEERSLYARFGAEEAAHLDAVSTALGPVDESTWQSEPFLDLLARIIEDGDRRTGQLLIQVVLEGWGLLHYASLRDDCVHLGLKAVLAGIVADEAGHHGSGVQLLQGVELGPHLRNEAIDFLDSMLAMVQVGPTLVAGAVERHLGGLTRSQRRRVFAELDAEAHVRTRLAKLRGCLGKVEAARSITAALADRGRFDVPTVEALV